MRRLLDLIGMSLGGWLGWVAGASLSLFIAFILGVIGTGLGLYAAHRFGRTYLP